MAALCAGSQNGRRALSIEEAIGEAHGVAEVAKAISNC
jgi:hypothetical protein